MSHESQNGTNSEEMLLASLCCYAEYEHLIRPFFPKCPECSSQLEKLSKYRHSSISAVPISKIFDLTWFIILSYFPSPLVLLSNLDLRGFRFPWFFWNACRLWGSIWGIFISTFNRNFITVPFLILL